MNLFHLPTVAAQVQNKMESEYRPETILFAPLKWGENCFGSIVLGRRGDRPFDSHHIKLVRHLSGYFANVFENAKMFQKINQAYLLTKDA